MYVLVNFDQIDRSNMSISKGPNVQSLNDITFQVNGTLELTTEAIFDSRSDKTIYFIMQIGH